MKGKLLEAADCASWRAALEAFERADVCQMPEYHLAYSLRTSGSRPLMWVYEEGGERFCYPFLLTPVVLEGSETGYTDVGSIYGYSGPLSTAADKKFLDAAWDAFDEWAAERKVIAEFVRFSLYTDNKAFAHKNMQVEYNRPSAVSHLPCTEDELFALLGKKTRNMIRKAEKAGFTAQELDMKEDLAAFRALYDETMDRNKAPGFFLYDDGYYANILAMPEEECRLFGVFAEGRLVSAAIALRHGKGALYHLGASLADYNSLGAGNLCLFEMSKGLMAADVEFLTVGGGRTTAEDDPLFRFKKSNATGVDGFHIGKRVVDKAGYQDVVKRWQELYNSEVSSEKLIFYRD